MRSMEPLAQLQARGSRRSHQTSFAQPRQLWAERHFRSLVFRCLATQTQMREVEHLILELLRVSLCLLS